MTKRVETISRRLLSECSENNAAWHPRYLQIDETIFCSPASVQARPFSHPEHYASHSLYDALQDAGEGRLEVPAHLEVDQIEDWFVMSAIKLGLEVHKQSVELNARLRSSVTV